MRALFFPSRPSIHRIFVILVMLIVNPLCCQTIWNIVNPSPPWDEYRNVFFIDDQIGWAVGQEGSVIKTENGGLDWYSIAPIVNGDFYEVQFLNDSLGWIGGSGIFRTEDGGNNWEFQFEDDTYGFHAMYFIDENTGYAGTLGGTIYKTSDGGWNWVKISEDWTWVTQLYFFDEWHGWAIDRYRMFRTINGGLDWEVSLYFQPLSPVDDLHAFHFFDDDHGWLVTRGNYIFRTADGGGSWDTLPGPEGASGFYGLTAVHFFDLDHGLVFDENGCFITQDGGDSFIPAGGDYLHVRAVHFPNDTFGYAVGERQQYSMDAGNTWTRTDIGHTHDQDAVWMGSGGRIITGGYQGTLMLSEDYGLSWEEISSPTGNNIRSLHQAPEGIIWGCGDAGTVFHSIDEGVSWSLSGFNFNGSLQSISFGSALNGICVGHGGTIYSTQDQGATWIFSTSPTNKDLNDVFHVDPNVAWICGDDGYLLKTEDGGDSWVEYFLDNGQDLFSICFVSSEKGWVTSRGKIFATINGGESWTLQLSDVPGIWSDRIYSIMFQDAMNGWSVGEDGLMLHTRDAGMHWSVHLPLIEDNLFDLAFWEMDQVTAVGENGNVLFTYQGTYLAPHVVSLPPDTIVCEGEEIDFLCEATGDSLSYQWLYGGEEMPGETSAVLHFDSISVFAGGLYSCRLTNGAGILESEEFKVSVIPQARVTADPANQTVFETDTVIFNQAVVGGLPIFYQWQKNGEDIPGANFHIYLIYNIKLSDSGLYRCIVSNDCAIDTTESAQVTVLPASAVDEFDLLNISIQPNPVKDYCRIHFEKGISDGNYWIYDMKGTPVLSGESKSAKSISINVEMLESGIYFFRFLTPTNNTSLKFIKQ